MKRHSFYCPFPVLTPRLMPKLLPAALACMLVTPSAFAGGDDSDGFHGYFRAGAGSGSGIGGRQNCFGLGGNTMRYRLGNECDAYGEFYYTREVAKSADGASFVATAGIQEYSPNSTQNLGSVFSDVKDKDGKVVAAGESGGTGFHMHWIKAYIEAKNLPFLNGGTAWVGQRQYRRPDIHMLDLQYTNLNGTGAGIDRVKAGPGQFSYAIFKDNDNNVGAEPGNSPQGQPVVNTTAAWRHNVIYEGLPINPGGTLDILTTLISAKGEGKHGGYQLTLLHNQGKVFGGGNTLGLQYGVGPGTGVGICCNRMGASGSTALGSDVKRMRLFDSLWVQPTKEFSAEMVALWQRDQSNAGGSSTWTSFGIRPVYAVHQNFKLQAELGTDRVTVPNGPALRLTKLTLAPTLTLGEGYWSRPELRAFVTYGKWNDAAKGAVNAANESGAVFGNKRSGTSYGVQVEAWF